MKVPSNPLAQSSPSSNVQPDETAFAMATATMHQLGQLPEKKPPLAGRLKDMEKTMEGTQRFRDMLGGEDKPRKPRKEQDI